jgi:hypothetical protein
MPLVLVAPGLLSSPSGAFEHDPAFARLAGHAGGPRVHPTGIAGAMLQASQWPDGTPVAPLAALGAGTDPGDTWVIVADPVHLDAGAAEVVLTRRVDDLRRDESDALVATLSAHFAIDGLRFVAPRAGAWFVLAAQAPQLTTTDLDAVVGRSLLAHMPRGPDARTWKRWQDEIGMLLHDHPVNAARERERRQSANGVWFWGGGRLARGSAQGPVHVSAAAGCAGDIARGMALASHGRVTPWPPPPGWPGTAPDRRGVTGKGSGSAATAIVVTEPIGGESGEDGAAAFARDRLEPALALLEGRSIDALHVVADGNGVAATWTARPSGPLARLSARLRRQSFRIPRAAA